MLDTSDNMYSLFDHPSLLFTKREKIDVVVYKLKIEKTMKNRRLLIQFFLRKITDAVALWLSSIHFREYKFIFNVKHVKISPRTLWLEGISRLFMNDSYGLG